ncbi:MAG: hypothetical protein ACRDYA_14300 [Egibacteraceae bacterium]
MSIGDSAHAAAYDGRRGEEEPVPESHVVPAGGDPAALAVARLRWRISRPGSGRC